MTRLVFTSGPVVALLFVFFARSVDAEELTVSIGSTLGIDYWPSTHYTLNRTNVDFKKVSQSLGVSYSFATKHGSVTLETRFGMRDFTANSYTPPERASGYANILQLVFIGRHYFSQGSKRFYAGIGAGKSDISTHVDNSAANVSLSGVSLFFLGGIEAEYFNFLVLSVESRLGMLWMKDSYHNKISTPMGSVRAGISIRWPT